MASQYIDLFQTLGTGSPPGGAAGGFLSGTYPNPGSNLTYLNYANRTLIAATGLATIDWGARFMYNTSSRITVDWASCQLKTDIVASLSLASLDWSQRTLLDNNGDSQCLNWGSRLLCYSDSSTALNWSTGSWFDSGARLSLSITDCSLYDFGGQLAVQWGNYYLGDSSGLLALDWNNRQLYDFSGDISIDFGSRVLQNNTGSTTLDYGNYQLTLNNIAIFDWYTQTFRDPSGNPQLSFGTSGVAVTNVVNSFGGISTVGNGVTVVRRYDQKISQSATIADTTLYTTPNGPGFYTMSVYVFCSTGGSAATVSSQVKWTDNSSVAQTANALSVTNIVLGTIGTFATGTAVIQAKALSDIKYNVTVSGSIGTGRYQYWIVLEQLI